MRFTIRDLSCSVVESLVTVSSDDRRFVNDKFLSFLRYVGHWTSFYSTGNGRLRYLSSSLHVHACSLPTTSSSPPIYFAFATIDKTWTSRNKNIWPKTSRLYRLFLVLWSIPEPNLVSWRSELGLGGSEHFTDWKVANSTDSETGINPRMQFFWLRVIVHILSIAGKVPRLASRLNIVCQKTAFILSFLRSGLHL